MKLHAKNIISLFGFDALIRLVGFVSTTYLARVLGGGAFGLVNLGLAICSYGIIFGSPGVHIIGTRLVSQGTAAEGTFVSKIIWLRVVLSTIALAVVFGISFLFVSDHSTRIVVTLYSLSLLPYALSLDWYFQGKRRIAVIGGSRFISLVVFALLLFLFVKSESALPFVPIAYLINTALVALIMFVFYLKQKRFDIPASPHKLSPPTWRSLLGQSIPVGMANFMGQALLNLPVLLLGFFATSIDIGNFSAASKFIFFLLAIDRGIYSLFYPLIARTVATNRQDLAHQVSRAVRYLVILAFPICVGGILLARGLVSFIFGQAYGEAVVLLQILLFYFLFTILNSIFAFAVIATGREKRYSGIIVSISSVLFVVLVPLTYLWRAAGASVGMAVGEFVMMVMMLRECRRAINMPMTFDVIRPLTATLIMGLVLLFLGWPLFSSLAIGAASYLFALILVRGFTLEDVHFLRERLV